MPMPAGVETGALSRIVGGIVLVLGCIGGLVIMSKYGSIEVGFGQTVRNPMAIWAGVGVIVQSVMWAVFGFAIAAAAENSAAMRQELWELRNEARTTGCGNS
jgi:hypothetical protein